MAARKEDNMPKSELTAQQLHEVVNDEECYDYVKGSVSKMLESRLEKETQICEQRIEKANRRLDFLRKVRTFRALDAEGGDFVEKVYTLVNQHCKENGLNRGVLLDHLADCLKLLKDS